MPEEHNPCEEEPCKSALRRYREALADLRNADGIVQRLCGAFARALRLVWVTLVLWMFSVAAYIACVALVGEAFCQALLVAVIIGTILLLMALALLAEAYARLRRAQQLCERFGQRYVQAIVDMQDNCPKECWDPIDTTRYCACR